MIPKARITLTPELSHASGTDAANRQMRSAGRKRWSVEDYNLAVRTQARLLHHLDGPYEQIAADMA